MTEEKNTLIPMKLIKYLIGLWIAVINLGLDFGLLIHGRWNPGKFILMCMVIIALGAGVYCTKAIINFFRELQTDAENQLI